MYCRSPKNADLSDETATLLTTDQKMKPWCSSTFKRRNWVHQSTGKHCLVSPLGLRNRFVGSRRPGMSGATILWGKYSMPRILLWADRYAYKICRSVLDWIVTGPRARLWTICILVWQCTVIMTTQQILRNSTWYWRQKPIEFLVRHFCPSSQSSPSALIADFPDRYVDTMLNPPRWLPNAWQEDVEYELASLLNA